MVQSCGTLAVAVVQKASGTAETEQVRHCLGRSLHGQVLAGHEVEPVGSHPRAVASRCS